MYAATNFRAACDLWLFICCRALQEAQDIFGVDFDFDDFDQYEDEYDEAEEEEDEDVSSRCWASSLGAEEGWGLTVAVEPIVFFLYSNL